VDRNQAMPADSAAQLKELLGEDIRSVLRRERTAFDELAAPFGNRLVLFGAGTLGRKTLRGLRSIGVQPLAFADNDARLWNTLVDDLPVLSPMDAARRFGDNSAFVTTIWRGTERQAARTRQLLDLNCRTVVPFGYLFWKHDRLFLPHAYLDAPHEVLQHAAELRRLYHLWADEESRREYLAQLRFRLRMDFDALPPPQGHAQYFPDDLLSITPTEVFVDCGAFDGDTIRQLLHRQGDSFAKVIAFEPDEANFSKLADFIQSLEPPVRSRVRAFPFAVGDRQDRARFRATGTISSSLAEDGTVEVRTVTLDQAVLDEGPTYVKLDIEGAEAAALIGSRRLLKTLRPIVAVCLYHRPEDLWRLPLLIDSMADGYAFFLRTYGEEGWELVCYAVPASRAGS
jgi:FkbM family methyltransferase